MGGGKGGASGGRRSVNVTPPTTPRTTGSGYGSSAGSASGAAGVGIFGMRPIPSSALPSASRGLEDDETDPETVAAGGHRSFGTARPNAARDGEVHDDPTVQLSRLPISFIHSESVMDPETVQDQRPEAARWREDTQARYDEMPPAPLPSAVPDRSTTTLARGIDKPSMQGIYGHRDLRRAPLESPETPASWSFIDPRTAVLAPLLGGAVGGFVFMLILLALYAGSP
jgi:hypothetical protein